MRKTTTKDEDRLLLGTINKNAGEMERLDSEPVRGEPDISEGIRKNIMQRRDYNIISLLDFSFVAIITPTEKFNLGLNKVLK